MSEVALRYFHEHGFTPSLAAFYGVTVDPPATVRYRCFDADGGFVRWRNLLASRKATRQPKGRPLRVCWLAPPPARARDLLLCEGEPDALAAQQARHTPPHRYAAAAVIALKVAFLPGTGTPAKRVLEEIERLRPLRVFLAFDEDEAGEKAAGRVLKAARPLGVALKRLRLPEPYNDLADALAGSSGNRADALMALMAGAQ